VLPQVAANKAYWERSNMMIKKIKCDLCEDGRPVAWYWYGSEENPNCLAVCPAHEHRVLWITPFCYRIEKVGQQPVVSQEKQYSRKKFDEMLRKTITHHEPRKTNDAVRECLIDAIIEELPIQVSRKTFDDWDIEALKRFSPLQMEKRSGSFERLLPETSTHRDRPEPKILNDILKDERY
jgi:hypothetical protein